MPPARQALGYGPFVAETPSPTPLARKLALAEGHRLVLVHAPRRWTVPDLPAGVTVSRRRGSRADVAVAFYATRVALEREVAALAETVPPTSSLWLA